MKTILIILVTISSISLAAQPSDLLIHGRIKEYNTDSLLDDCVINIFMDSKKSITFEDKSDGEFNFLVSLDHVYLLEFSRKGYISKSLIIDTNNIPEEDRIYGFSIGPISMYLFKPVKGADFSILEKPIGQARYYPKQEAIEWNDNYSDKIANHLDSIFKRHNMFDYAETDSIESAVGN